MPGTTPVYGFPYPEPTDLVADYPALGQQLAEDIETTLPTIGGLSPAIPTTIANSGGTATLSGNTVTFTGVTSVSLNGCFTSAAENYFMVTNYTRSTTGGNVTLRMRAAGVDASTGIYDYALYYMYFGGGGTGATVAAAQTSAAFTGLQGTGAVGISAQILKPQLTQRTQITYGANTEDNSSFRSTLMGGITVVSTSSYDGFTLTSSTATMTGTVSVYAYKK